jgi:glycosyltransferase involved in cell wall biosynthesis
MSTFLFSAARYLRHVEVDRVVAHWVVPCGWPLGLCNRAPLEVVAHGSDVRLLQGLPRAVRSAIVGTLLRRNTRFRFVAASLREELVASTSERLRERSNVAPSPFDIPPNLNRKLARTLLDVPESERLLVMVGRLIPGKRFDVALSAATLLPKARVVMVGDGPERVALASRFPAALFTGMLPRKQALRWIAAADVLIATSLEEGAPTVVREARALGVDVVAVDSADLALWADTDPGIHLVKSPAQGRR